MYCFDRPTGGRRLPAVGRVRWRGLPDLRLPDRWPSGCSSAGGSRDEIPIWSLAYFRFWLVKTLVRSNPLVAVRRVAAVRAVPAGAGREGRAGRRDLLPERARLHRPAHHRRRHGHPQGLVLHRLPGPRRRDPDRPGHPRAGTCFVGEKTVLDIDTSMGDGAQLGHASVAARRAGGARRRALARVPGPAHRRWTTGRSSRADCGTLRRAVYAVVQLLNVLFGLPAAGDRRRWTCC